MGDVESVIGFFYITAKSLLDGFCGFQALIVW